MLSDQTHMKATKLTLLLCTAYVQQLAAQSIRYTISQPYINLSAYSTSQNDPLSFTGNQASLASLKSPGMGVFAETRFLLSQNSVYSAGASFKTSLGNIGVQVKYAGFKNFNDNNIGVAYARRLGKLADIGIQFNYYGYRIAGYGHASTLNFEIGTLLHLSKTLHAGVHVYNPLAANMGKHTDEKLAAVYKCGLGYDASENFFIGAEIVKEEDKPVTVIAGFQYQFAKQFFAKAGFISGSASAYAGAGVAWKNIRLDISSGYHPQLGFSPALLLLYYFKHPHP